MDDFPEIEALKKGSQSAFNSLIQLFSQKVYNLSLGILQNDQDAEDVTQEIFTTVFLSINQFKGDSKLSTWIYRISVNKLNNPSSEASQIPRSVIIFVISLAGVTSNP